MRTEIIISFVTVFAFGVPLVKAADDLDIYGGTFTIDSNYNWVGVYNDAVVNMYDFSILHLDTYNSSKFNLYGGTLTDSKTIIWDSSTFNMSGGILWDIDARGSSVLNISGGDVSNWITASDNSTIFLTGGDISTLYTPDTNAYFHVYGYDFDIDESGVLRGYWENGNPLEISLRLNMEYLVLHEIPEPQSIFMLGLGVIIARRKIKTKS